MKGVMKLLIVVILIVSIVPSVSGAASDEEIFSNNSLDNISCVYKNSDNCFLCGAPKDAGMTASTQEPSAAE